MGGIIFPFRLQFAKFGVDLNFAPPAKDGKEDDSEHDQQEQGEEGDGRIIHRMRSFSGRRYGEKARLASAIRSRFGSRCGSLKPWGRKTGSWRMELVPLRWMVRAAGMQAGLDLRQEARGVDRGFVASHALRLETSRGPGPPAGGAGEARRFSGKPRPDPGGADGGFD